MLIGLLNSPMALGNQCPANWQSASSSSFLRFSPEQTKEEELPAFLQKSEKRAKNRLTLTAFIFIPYLLVALLFFLLPKQGIWYLLAYTFGGFSVTLLVIAIVLLVSHARFHEGLSEISTERSAPQRSWIKKINKRYQIALAMAFVPGFVLLLTNLFQ